MTLFATVKVYRKGIEESSHLYKSEAEMGWVVNEGENGQVVVAGFAADGSVFTATGKLDELTAKPVAAIPKPIGANVQPIPLGQPSTSA